MEKEVYLLVQTIIYHLIPMQNPFKYFAFISYNSKDTAWGKRLQKKLEHYRMPSALCNEHGWQRTPIKPVFFAPTDIQPGGLSEELKDRLKASQHLIVICSPNSAKSKWVGREIEFFHNLGRTKNIHFFIIEGTPHSGNPDTECFNPVIEHLGLPEILGANIHEKASRLPWVNRERAYVQLISKLLGVEFDAIWQRHKRRMARKVAAWVIGAIVIICTLFAVWKANQPVDVAIHLNEASVHNGQLPPLKDAVITLNLDNETKTDTIHLINNNLIFNNIPHKFINKPTRIGVLCRDFMNLDTTLTLTPDITLNLYRDPQVYGNVHFRLWNPEEEHDLPNTTVWIDGLEATSDANGNISLFIPLELQKEAYRITASFRILNDSIFMPCGEDDVILAE